VKSSLYNHSTSSVFENKGDPRSLRRGMVFIRLSSCYFVRIGSWWAKVLVEW